MSLSLIDAYAANSHILPGSVAKLVVELNHEGDRCSATLGAQLFDRSSPVTTTESRIELRPGQQQVSIDLPVPEEDRAGYLVQLRVQTSDQTLLATSSVLVVSHWRHAPRYGFLSEFPPGVVGKEQIQELAKFHITVVQFYDWMYRHYQFLPPEQVFRDAMGRKLSLDTIRERIASCQELGMATLAYGAVYGAEPEFIADRPDWVLRDNVGEMLNLIELFYITDLRPGSPWRSHILAEYETAVSELAFDGIHMDQYGFPKWAYHESGESVDLASCFPGLIDEANYRVKQHRGQAEVLFNAVNNWPVEQTSKANQAALYVEVWSPHDRYRDLVDLVKRGRDLSRKHVILAAYLESFKEGGVGAEHSALVATSVIASAGGFHLLIGEGRAVLRDPYYPNHSYMSDDFYRRMRRYYDYTAANHAYLFNHEYDDVTSSVSGGINQEIVLRETNVSVIPEAGSVWMTIKQKGRQFVINLVNLVGLSDDEWNAPKERPTIIEGGVLVFSRHYRISSVSWSSPDEAGSAKTLEYEFDAGECNIHLPPLEYWATLVVEVR